MSTDPPATLPPGWATTLDRLGDSINRLLSEAMSRESEYSYPTPEDALSGERTASWQRSLDRLGERLAAWQGQVEQLARKVGHIDSVLAEQQVALTDWRERLATIGPRLTEGPPSL